jgi:hypothetical protein
MIGNSHDPCVNAAVAAYLINFTVPKNLTCPAVRPRCDTRGNSLI